MARPTRFIIASSATFLGSFLLTLFVSMALTLPAPTNAQYSDVNVTLEPSASLTITDDAAATNAISQVSMQVSPNADGVFITRTVYVNASSNNETGYVLTFSDTDDNTSLVHADPSITTQVASIPAATADFLASNFPANMWGYAFDHDASYHPIPALSSPREVENVSLPGSTTYPLTIATKVDTATPSGIYTDTLIFTLTANFVPQPHTVVFEKNATSYNPITPVTGEQMESIVIPYDKEVQLPKSTYSRLGYRFLGWSTDKEATEAAHVDEATVKNLADGTGGTVTLYAIWQPKNLLTTITNMQEITPALCEDTYLPAATTSATNTNLYYSSNSIPEYTLRDARDNKTYLVRKYADGRCWMAQGLALGGTSAVTIQAATSDFDSGSFQIPASAGGNWGSETQRVQASYINTRHMYSNGNYWMDGTTLKTSGTPASPTQYIGNFYNYYTATAGTGTYSTTSGVDAPSSICPKGWKIPTGDTGGEWGNWIEAYSNNSVIKSSLSAGGFYYDQQVAYRGLMTVYVTSTAYSDSANYIVNFQLTNSYIYKDTANFKTFGQNLRCIARQ